MATPALLFSLATLILSISLAVTCAVACWRWVSAATPRRKQPPSVEPTPTSGQLAKLEADQVELFAALEKTSASLKRLTSRAAVQDHRERARNGSSSGPPPVGTSKAELLRHYGMSGKVGPAFAQAQLEMEHHKEPN